MAGVLRETDILDSTNRFDYPILRAEDDHHISADIAFYAVFDQSNCDYERNYTVSLTYSSHFRGPPHTDN